MPRITNPRLGKKQKVMKLKRVSHDVPDPKTGNIVGMECVEFVVIGRYRRWKDWMTYAEFAEANPGVKVA